MPNVFDNPPARDPEEVRMEQEIEWTIWEARQREIDRTGSAAWYESCQWCGDLVPIAYLRGGPRAGDPCFEWSGFHNRRPLVRPLLGVTPGVFFHIECSDQQLQQLCAN